MSEKLKHCPFCGGDAELSNFETMSEVICKKCGAKSRLIESSSKYCSDEKAIEAWNRRIENKNE